MAEVPCETLASLPQDLQALVLLSVGRKRELQNARRVCSTWRRLMTATWFGEWRNARKQLPANRQCELVRLLRFGGLEQEADVRGVKAVLRALRASIILSGDSLLVPKEPDPPEMTPAERMSTALQRCDEHFSAAAGLELCTGGRTLLVTWTLRTPMRCPPRVRKLAYTTQVFVVTPRRKDESTHEQRGVLEILRVREEERIGEPDEEPGEGSPCAGNQRAAAHRHLMAATTTGGAVADLKTFVVARLRGEAKAAAGEMSASWLLATIVCAAESQLRLHAAAEGLRPADEEACSALNLADDVPARARLLAALVTDGMRNESLSALLPIRYPSSTNLLHADKHVLLHSWPASTGAERHSAARIVATMKRWLVQGGRELPQPPQYYAQLAAPAEEGQGEDEGEEGGEQGEHQRGGEGGEEEGEQDLWLL